MSKERTRARTEKHVNRRKKKCQKKYLERKQNNEIGMRKEGKGKEHGEKTSEETQEKEK